jgi:hypothetical protein
MATIKLVGSEEFSPHKMLMTSVLTTNITAQNHDFFNLNSSNFTTSDSGFRVSK